MNRMTRCEIMEMFKKEVREGRILVGVGAGTGITAKCSEKAGADMLIIYNSGRFRMAGRGSLSGLRLFRKWGQRFFLWLGIHQYLPECAERIRSVSWICS